MRKDKSIAVKLRKEGKSYRQIRDELKIPLSTLSDWLSNIDWSKKIAEELTKNVQVQHTARIKALNTVRGMHLQRAYEEATREAGDEFERLKYHPLFIAGIMLYWGEGDRRSANIVRLTNTDPKMILLFKNFLLDICGVRSEKIKCYLTIYPDIEEKSNRLYWSENVGLPTTQFTKSILIQGKHKTRRLEHGVCTILVSSSYLKKKLLAWLELLPNELISEPYYANI